MKKFIHNFKEPLTNDEINQVIGYQQALSALYKQLEEMTKFKPENRFIDARTLLDMISETNSDFERLFAAKKIELNKILTT